LDPSHFWIAIDLRTLHLGSRETCSALHSLPNLSLVQVLTTIKTDSGEVSEHILIELAVFEDNGYVIGKWHSAFDIGRYWMTTSFGCSTAQSSANVSHSESIFSLIGDWSFCPRFNLVICNYRLVFWSSSAVSSDLSRFSFSARAVILAILQR
jgi:hypothetical protein